MLLSEDVNSDQIPVASHLLLSFNTNIDRNEQKVHSLVLFMPSDYL